MRPNICLLAIVFVGAFLISPLSNSFAGRWSFLSDVVESVGRVIFRTVRLFGKQKRAIGELVENALSQSYRDVEERAWPSGWPD